MIEELKSSDVKNAVAKRLLEIAPAVSVYKEATTKPVFPHFFVYQMEVSDDEERKGFHILSYSMTVRYRVASDPSTDLKLEQDLDEMALKLLRGFNIIDFGQDKVKCVEKRYEKIDGVLHFFFTISVLAKAVAKDDETVKQGKLNLEVELDGNKA